MSEKIKVVQGDTRPQLIFSITDQQTLAPINLSDSSTVTLVKFRPAGSATVKATMTCGKLPGVVLEDGSINFAAPYDVPGAGGRLYMNWSPTALDTAGDFEAEIEITFADGTIQTAFDTIKFKVRPQF